MPLRRMCSLLLLDGIFYKHQLSSTGLKCHLRLLFPCYFLLDDLSIDESGVLKSPTITMFPSISPFRLLVFASHIEMLLCWVHIYFSSVAQSCLTLCDHMNCSTPGFPVHHQLPRLAQIMPIKSVMPFNHLILCCSLLLLPSIFPSIREFSKVSVLCIR